MCYHFNTNFISDMVTCLKNVNILRTLLLKKVDQNDSKLRFFLFLKEFQFGKNHFCLYHPARGVLCTLVESGKAAECKSAYSGDCVFSKQNLEFFSEIEMMPQKRT